MKLDSGKVHSPAKRIRDRDELEEQARLFGQDWHAGDRIQTWLNRHEGKLGELSQMVEDGWSWGDVGRAMHIAGITYRTGEPIAPDLLRRKAYRARVEARSKIVRLQAKALQDPGGSVRLPAQQQPGFRPPQPTVALSPGEQASSVWDEEPEFKPISLLNWSGKLITDEEKPPKKEPVPGPKIDVDAVIRRLLGKE